MGKTQKIILKHSSIQGKTPKELEYGEPAVNYCAGNEFISIKNTNNEIVKFEAQPKVDLSKYAMKEELPIDKINSFLGKTILTDNSMAIGINNSIDFWGRDSFAFGRDNNVSGNGSYAIGERNRIEAGSFAFGYSNMSSYPNNVIIGKNNYISAQHSYTFGGYNKPQGNQSFAFGYGLSTTSQYEVALGRYNESDGNTLFSIGNGEGIYREKNIFSIAKDAKAYVVDIEDKSKKPQMICLQDKLAKDTVQLTFTLEDGTSQTLNVCTR